MRAKIGNLELEIESEADLSLLSAFAFKQQPAVEPAKIEAKPKVVAKPKKVGKPKKSPWTKDEDYVLLSNPLAKAKRLLKRSRNAIYMRRMALKKKGASVPEPQVHTGKFGKNKSWTTQEDALVLSGLLSHKEVAKKLGRTNEAVAVRHSFLRKKNGLI